MWPWWAATCSAVLPWFLISTCHGHTHRCRFIRADASLDNNWAQHRVVGNNLHMNNNHARHTLEHIIQISSVVTAELNAEINIYSDFTAWLFFPFCLSENWTKEKHLREFQTSHFNLSSLDQHWMQSECDTATLTHSGQTASISTLRCVTDAQKEPHVTQRGLRDAI